MGKTTVTVMVEKRVDAQPVTVLDDAPASLVLSELVHILELPTTALDGSLIIYEFRIPRSGQQIFGEMTLAGSGVREGEILQIAVRSSPRKVLDLTYLTPLPASSTESAAAALPFPRRSEYDAKPHPWRRYWARMIDTLALGFGVSIVLAFLAPNVLQMPRLLLGFFLHPVVLLIEAVLLSTVGTTLGKALLNVRVRKINGDLPTLFEATVRAFYAWAVGLGAGVPVVSLFTLINAYTGLTRDEVTPWDQSGLFTVSCGRIGAGRIILITLFVICYVALQL